MKFRFILIFGFVFWQFSYAQQGFQLDPSKKKAVIHFKLINNLIFIPVTVNGVDLNFLLDTGVDETILLSIDDKEAVSLNDVEKIQLRGLGSAASIEGLRSTNNILSINGLTDKNHTIYIVLDQGFNFSSHIGIPVNGIIGYHFFKNNLVEINYDQKKIIVRPENEINRKKMFKSYTSLPISIEKNKPYLDAFVTISEQEIPAKLLLDLGNSDALWLFQDINSNIKAPSNNFEDFLGVGFSGEVLGKRTKISEFKMDKFIFHNPIIAMPDTNSVKSVNIVKDRVGSVGGEIFKRFSVVFDYNNSKMFLRKSNQYDAPFHYNLSGIEVQNNGLQWIQETVTLGTDSKDQNLMANEFKYKFSLQPNYIISNIRKNSQAEIVGLKVGDVIVSLNNVLGYKYTLEKINKILKAEKGNFVILEVDRNGQILKFKIQLIDIL